MNTHRKYQKTYRIDMKSLFVKGKHTLDKKKEKLLLDGTCHIFEKLDGGQVQLYKDKFGKIYLGKKGGEIDNSHPQYTFFQTWAIINQHKLNKLPNNIVIYLELLVCVHTVYYDNLPDMCLVFDIFDLKKDKFMEWDTVTKICKDVDIFTVPLLYEGKTDKNHLMKLIPKESKYGTFAEGMVVKNYNSQLRGKIVKTGFKDELEEVNAKNKHWRFRKIKFNNIKDMGKYGIYTPYNEA